VIRNLPDKYEPIDIFISTDGTWHIHGMEKTPAQVLPSLDVVFNALHGAYGEDGKVQKILEQFGVPYTGSQSLPSAIAMNKHLTKKSLIPHGIKMAFHKLFHKKEVQEMGYHSLFRLIPNPSIIKPVSAGSSVGVSLVKSFDDLESALHNAFEHDDVIVVEEYIAGTEATCGIIDDYRGEKHYALLPVEIVPHVDNDFFDYDAKYGGGTKELCPGNFSPELTKTIQDYARRAHAELGLRHYSRSDFIVHPKRGVFFLETNTLPGLTPESLLPKSLIAVGSTLPHFLDHVISLARR
jgi:D-alanine-D-alanine ligase